MVMGHIPHAEYISGMIPLADFDQGISWYRSARRQYSPAPRTPLEMSMNRSREEPGYPWTDSPGSDPASVSISAMVA